MAMKTAGAKVKLGAGLRQELKVLLSGGGAHASLEAATAGFPAELQGATPRDLPYSGWQLLEHLRIAQRDILEFCRNADGSYQPRKWPDEYWPTEPAPPEAGAWAKSLRAIHAERTAFEELLSLANDDEMVRPFAWGEGQTLLHEALLIADHTAYHVGELIVVRRLLGAWKK